MSGSELWLHHLSSSLRASRQAAYLYHVEEDRYEFMGDCLGVLGLEEEALPRNKENFLKFICPADLVNRQLSLADTIGKSTSGDKNFSLSYKMVRPDGTLIPVIETGVVHHDKVSKKTTIQSLLVLDTQTIERQKKNSRKMDFRSSISNAFSGSSGRQALLQSLESLLENRERDYSRGYLLAVGIDRLSLVNEIYGSQVADDVLLETEKRLQDMSHGRAQVLRWSGDVFALLFPTADQAEMADTANSIIKVFYRQPIMTEERPLHIMVSIGGIKLDNPALRANSVATRADMALQEAKQKGRGCFAGYTDKLNEEVNSFKDALAIGDDFLKAFREGRVKLAFQGIINSRTSNVSFYECLMRMVDEDGNIRSAGSFIPAVEKMGLTRLVDTYCVRQAIYELKKFPTISLSVNVSNHTLTDPDWLKEVTLELRDHVDVANRLIIEITESVAMSDLNQTLRVIRVLEDLGCRIALDDFGVGQTAFSQIKELSLDIVKIDKSFVQEMNKEGNKLFIRTLHSLASGMNLETVGEGAETLAEADILAKDGIDHIQGYAYGLPSIERLWLAADDEQRVSDQNSATPHTASVQ